MALDEGKLAGYCVEAPDMSGALRDQVDDHAHVDEMVVDDHVDLALDVREIHVSKVVGAQQEDREDSAHADQEPGDERNPDQKMAPLHEETGIGRRVRRRKHGEEIVERLGMSQK